MHTNDGFLGSPEQHKLSNKIAFEYSNRWFFTRWHIVRGLKEAEFLHWCFLWQFAPLETTRILRGLLVERKMNAWIGANQKWAIFSKYFRLKWLPWIAYRHTCSKTRKPANNKRYSSNLNVFAGSSEVIRKRRSWDKASRYIDQGILCRPGGCLSDIQTDNAFEYEANFRIPRFLWLTLSLHDRPHIRAHGRISSRVVEYCEQLVWLGEFLCLHFVQSNQSVDWMEEFGPH